MERKIGEIFKYNGEWYQCVKSIVYCPDCAFYKNVCDPKIFGICGAIRRSDGNNVIFKKLEKVGEPFSCDYYGDSPIMMQEYNLYNLDDVTNEDNIPMYITDYKHKRIAIEIKQTKEDMVEKKLKPFDIQKAREGKPVCTRDGRKARIICYDRQSDHGFPLVVLVENTGAEKDEDVHFYRANGTAATAERAQDLMMAPEHHVGYINVYSHPESKSYWAENVFDTKEDAYENIRPILEGVVVVATVKIEWEE